MTSLSQDLPMLQQSVVDLQTTNFLTVACFTALVYDLLITISVEVSLIWTTRRPLGKIIFSAIRYPILLEGIAWLFYSFDQRMDSKLCRFIGVLSIWTTVTFTIPIQVIMVLRTIAIWNQGYKVTIVLIVATLVSDTIMIVSMLLVTKRIVSEPIPLDRYALACSSGLETIPANRVTPALVSLMTFDALIIVLTLFRPTKKCVNRQNMLLNVLIRDGIAYYVIMLAISIVNLVVYMVFSENKRGRAIILLPLLRTSMSILGGRIVLNMREVAASTSNQYTTPSRITDISFWIPPDNNT